VPMKKNGLPSMTKEVPERETKPAARFVSWGLVGEDWGWRMYADVVITPKRRERMDEGRIVEIGIKTASEAEMQLGKNIRNPFFRGRIYILYQFSFPLRNGRNRRSREESHKFKCY
jgi:hypothetical protein